MQNAPLEIYSVPATAPLSSPELLCHVKSQLAASLALAVDRLPPPSPPHSPREELLVLHWALITQWGSPFRNTIQELLISTSRSELRQCLSIAVNAVPMCVNACVAYFNACTAMLCPLPPSSARNSEMVLSVIDELLDQTLLRRLPPSVENTMPRSTACDGQRRKRIREEIVAAKAFDATDGSACTITAEFCSLASALASTLSGHTRDDEGYERGQCHLASFTVMQLQQVGAPADSAVCEELTSIKPFSCSEGGVAAQPLFILDHRLGEMLTLKSDGMQRCGLFIEDF